MKVKTSLALLFLMLAFGSGYAQNSETAAEAVDRLKSEMIELQIHEESLRARLQELDEAIKPENIERSLAGVGSTRPEELREWRRKQLSKERDSVQSQLNLLANHKQRLETLLNNAQVAAYQESAQPPLPTNTNQMMVATGPRTRLFAFGGGGLALFLVSAGALLYKQKRNRNKTL